jgi:hypothetical protein
MVPTIKVELQIMQNCKCYFVLVRAIKLCRSFMLLSLLAFCFFSFRGATCSKWFYNYPALKGIRLRVETQTSSRRFRLRVKRLHIHNLTNQESIKPQSLAEKIQYSMFNFRLSAKKAGLKPRSTLRSADLLSFEIKNAVSMFSKCSSFGSSGYYSS